MPALVKRLTPRGLQSVDYDADSLDDAARFEDPAGVYTTSNTLNETQTLLLDAHLERLEASARQIGMDWRCDRPRLRAALRKMIAESGFGDTRFRLTVPSSHSNLVIISIEPYTPPSEALIRRGVRCDTTSALARQNPAAKSSLWMRQRQALEESRSPDTYETFLLDEDGAILEGAGSNFYAIIGGELRTAGTGVLAGISRRVVLDIRAGIIPLRLQAPRLDELPRFAEAFLSSSSRGIIPVVAIDGEQICAGTPGEITMRLREAYQRWVNAHLEEL